MKRLLLLLAATAICGACENQAQQGSTPETRIAAHEAEQLLTDGIETLTIGSNSFVLEAYLWRDFMPMIIPEDYAVIGRPMISINRLVEVNSTAIPNNIELVKQYVIHGDIIWESKYENETRPEWRPHIMEKVSRNGPEWDTGILVDVIAEVRDSKTQKSHLIKCENILIERIY